jgi:hypothetical protein
MRAVVLVEGVSDQLALRTLAARRGRDLDAEGVDITPIGGAHALGAAVERLRLEHPEAVLAGLCDAPEEEVFARTLERVGLGSNLTRADMEGLGFYVCVSDLEDELVRALGVPAVHELIETQGELAAFRTFQKQPAKRALPLEEQVWRFMWNRKVRYAPLLVAALDLARAPRPLDGVLSHV